MIHFNTGNGTKVGYTHRVHGTIHGRSLKRGTPVQVLVWAADGKLYLQAPVHVARSGKWSVETVFGMPAGSKHDFNVLAIADAAKIKTSPISLEELPPRTAEAWLSVTRTA